MPDNIDLDKIYFDYLDLRIQKQILAIKYKDWKTAFEKLANWTIKNFGYTTLFDVTNKIKELRPE